MDFNPATEYEHELNIYLLTVIGESSTNSFEWFLERFKNEPNQVLIWVLGRSYLELGILNDENGEDKENKKPSGRLA